MKQGAHKRAFDAVSNNLLTGSIQEITHKPAWGFNELHRENITIGDQSEMEFFTNRIFHILLGEGVEWMQVYSALLQASTKTLRILILEHVPESPDFPMLSKDGYCNLETFLANFNCPVTKIDIDGRNTLFVITCLQDFGSSVNQLNHNNLEFFKSVRYRNLPFAGEEVYRVSSERQFDETRLLSCNDVKELQSVPRYPFISVVGGLMFLEALHELRSRDVILFDMSIKQLLYAKEIVDLIKANMSLNQFDKALKNYNPPAKVCYLWDGISNAVRTAPEESFEWVDVVRKGSWRKVYNQTRHILLTRNISYQLKSVTEMSWPPKSIAYLSTIPERLIKDCKSEYRITVSHKNNIPVLERQ